MAQETVETLVSQLASSRQYVAFRGAHSYLEYLEYSVVEWAPCGPSIRLLERKTQTCTNTM